MLGDPGTVKLPSSPCDKNYECRLQNIMTWYNTNETQRTNVLPCTPVQEVVIGADWKCANRNASKNLKDGAYPKMCLSATDCLLLDGTSTECVCTPRTSGTSGYCRPDVSSSFFQPYWDVCTLQKNMIKDKYEGFYWFLKTNFAVYYDTADLPACKGNFWEFQKLNETVAAIATSATSLLLAAGLLLA